MSTIEGIRPGRGILMVACQGFGDVVCCLPLLKAIESGAKDGCPVYVLLETPSRLELTAAENLSIRPLYMNSGGGGFRALGLIWIRLHGKIDLIISSPGTSERKLLALKRSLRASRLVAQSRPEYIKRIPESIPLDWSQTYLHACNDLAKMLGVKVPLPAPRITITREESAWADSVIASGGAASRPRIGVHCGAIAPAKSWPGRNFGTVLRALKGKLPKFAVISFGTFNEKSATEEARRAAGDLRWIDGTGVWSIRQSLAMLSKCELFISGDTGLMHMAAAVGVTTLSVFGPTSPIRRAPLHTGGLAVYSRLYCEYCQRLTGSTSRNPFNEPVDYDSAACVCTQNIPAESVAALALECLAGAGEAATVSSPPEVGVLRSPAVESLAPGDLSPCMESEVGES